ncbi:MAG: signal peptidase II [Clostridia bacterium]
MFEIIAFVAIVAADQLVKLWAGASLAAVGSMPFIPGVMNLTYAENTGAAFSMLSGNRIFLIAIPILVCLAVVYLLVSKRVSQPLLRWTFIFILAGAVGNLIDRIIHGYVVDMFEITLFKFAIFNVADIFVTAGAVMLFVYILFFSRDASGEPHAD